MGFEIPIDVDYFDHPKTVALIGMIGAEADVYPLRLWRWCTLYAKNGVIQAGRPQIEGACKWLGKPGKLYRALMKVGFIESDGVTIHSWDDHVGRAIKIYETKKRKQREKYAAEANDPEEDGKDATGAEIPPEGNGILPEENGSIPPTPLHSEKPHSEKSDSEKSVKPAAQGGRPKKPPPKVEIPEKLNTPAFAMAWGDWLAYRHGRRLTCAEATLRGQIGKLEKIGLEAAIKEIENSIAHGWQSVCYEKKTATSINGKHLGMAGVGPALFAAEEAAKNERF